MMVTDLVGRLRTESEQEQHLAVQALREMCLPKMERCAENRVDVGAYGGIELMVAMLDIPNADIKRSTCLALNEACLKNEANSRRFQKCGAIPRVMRVLQSGNADLQTQALAVLGTSAVNSVEVRRGLKEAGAIPLLVRLLASKTAGVQEWAAYALRKASARGADPQLGKSMIKEAVKVGADRLLVGMLKLRSRDAQEEAQQTLEYFEVDVANVQACMKREEATKPLVGMQRMCWMAVWHTRLGASSPARRLPLELVEVIAQQCGEEPTGPMSTSCASVACSV
jgi:HEAT repeat protein